MKDNYIIIPRISDQKKLAQYYSLADAFVICSKRENFPTTCLEAQCCGARVIGFDAGGTVETSIYGKGDFVETGDIDGLYKKTKEILLNTNKTEIAIEAKKLFSKERMIEDYIKLYDSGKKKERVLLIDVNCMYSSTGKIVYDLYQGIKSAGKAAQICYGRGEKILKDDIYKFGLDCETYLHALLSRITGYNGYFSAISTNRLIKKIDEFQPDIIHIHELHAYFVNFRPLIEYIISKKIPLVWTFHCEYAYTGKCGHAYDCDKYLTGCGGCPALQNYPKSLIFDKTRQMYSMKKNLLKDYDFTIVTPSQWLADRVGLSFLKDKEKKIIHNGIDTEIFQPVKTDSLRKELGIPNDYKTILACAPNILSEAKGGPWVIKLAQRMENEKVFFVLVGA